MYFTLSLLFLSSKPVIKDLKILSIESTGSTITQHVRELVKDCIEHAKISNEMFHQGDTSLENKTLLENKTSVEDGTQQQQKEEKDVQVENVREEYIYI